jgi:hypothetical protein
MPIFHKRPITISLLLQQIRGNTWIHAPESPTTTRSFYMLLLILQDCKVTMFYYNNCSRDRLNTLDLETPVALMSVSLTSFPFCKIAKSLLSYHSIYLWNYIPCVSLKCIHYIHYSYKLTLQVPFHSLKNFVKPVFTLFL